MGPQGCPGGSTFLRESTHRHDRQTEWVHYVQFYTTQHHKNNNPTWSIHTFSQNKRELEIFTLFQWDATNREKMSLEAWVADRGPWKRELNRVTRQHIFSFEQNDGRVCKQNDREGWSRLKPNEADQSSLGVNRVMWIKKIPVAKYTASWDWAHARVLVCVCVGKRPASQCALFSAYLPYLKHSQTYELRNLCEVRSRFKYRFN